MLDPSKAWRVFAKLKDNQSSVPMAPSALFEHFSRISRSEKADLFPIWSKHSVDPLDSHSGPISSEEVRSALAKTKPSSAPGPDGISPALVKEIFARALLCCTRPVFSSIAWNLVASRANGLCSRCLYFTRAKARWIVRIRTGQSPSPTS